MKDITTDINNMIDIIARLGDRMHEVLGHARGDSNIHLNEALTMLYRVEMKLDSVKQSLLTEDSK